MAELASEADDLSLHHITKVVLTHIDNVFKPEWADILERHLDNKRADDVDRTANNEEYALMAACFPLAPAGVSVSQSDELPVDWVKVLDAVTVRSRCTYHALQEATRESSYSCRRALTDIGSKFAVAVAAQEC